MRNRFDQQLSFGITPIEEVEFPTNNRDAFPALLKGLHHVYVTKELNTKIFQILSAKICNGKKPTGRKGMSLWELFVMAQVRLGLNISYDRLQDLSNNHQLMRSVMGVAPSDFTVGKQYEYQNIYDNVTLLDDQALKQINEAIVEAGHGVFKKKEQEALRIKVDSFVVESNVHFPTDYNLLWDSGRKCLDSIGHIIGNNPSLAGWRKIKNWRKDLKNKMRQLGRISAGGGKNKEERLRQAAGCYIKKARALSKKVHADKETLPFSTNEDVGRLLELVYFLEMLDKHIDLVERRLLKAETIPQREKVFSIFETYTRWITKGKSRPGVELGQKLLVSTDQHGLIVDHELMSDCSDATQAIAVGDRLLARHEIASISFDKGFWSKENKELLSLYIPEVVLPKRGKLSEQEKETEGSRTFRALNNAHSAVESNINELEHRGLDRCPDRGYEHFKTYISLGVCSYNLHKIGRELISQERAARKEKDKNRHKAAA